MPPKKKKSSCLFSFSSPEAERETAYNVKVAVQLEESDRRSFYNIERQDRFAEYEAKRAFHRANRRLKRALAAYKSVSGVPKGK